jgi:2'-5' RNA ligase
MKCSVLHRLFIGLRPPVPILSEMARIRDAFPCRSRVADDRLHMTLLPFPLQPDFPRLLAREIVAAISSVELPPCRIIVDRLVLGASSALLQPSEPVIGLLSLQRTLAELALEAGLRSLPGHRFSPHFTLFYGGPSEHSSAIEPISWTAEELVLIHSLHGLGRHETLERWPLRDPMRAPPEAPSRSAFGHAP